MRQDFAKLLCEKPRREVGYQYHKNGFRRKKFGYSHRLYNTIEEEEEYQVHKIEAHPNKENIHYKKGKRKSLNEHLNPLKGYLESCIGKKWDDVYSEICKTVPRRGVINLHVYQHLLEDIFKLKLDTNDTQYCISLSGHMIYPNRGYSRIRPQDFLIDNQGYLRSAKEYMDAIHEWLDFTYLNKVFENKLKNRFIDDFIEEVIEDSIVRYTIKEDKHKKFFIRIETYKKVPIECFEITGEEVYKKFGQVYNEEKKIYQWKEIAVPEKQQILIPKFDNKAFRKDGTEFQPITVNPINFNFHFKYNGSSDKKLYKFPVKIVVKHPAVIFKCVVTNPVYLWNAETSTNQEEVLSVFRKFWGQHYENEEKLTELSLKLKELEKELLHE